MQIIYILYSDVKWSHSCSNDIPFYNIADTLQTITLNAFVSNNVYSWQIVHEILRHRLWQFGIIYWSSLMRNTQEVYTMCIYTLFKIILNEICR